MSKTRFLKNMITATKVEPTENHEAAAASGVWSLGEQLEARRGSVWPETGIPDPNTQIENNFSVDLWSGDGDAATTTITNNLNLSGKGGLVWIKKRTAADNHMMIDTARGAAVGLESNTNSVENDISAKSFQFNTDGFQFDTADGQFNASNSTYVGWTFKKAPKFFSIFKFTHSNGTDTVKDFADDGITALGMVAVKKLDQANQNWNVWHRSLSSNTKKLRFNTTGAETNLTEFSISGTTVTFVSGEASADYVMYVWQHETGSDSMIQCGSIVGNGNDNRVIDLGWEPQFVMFKRRDSDSGGSWFVYDNMRGLIVGGADPYLKWDSNGDEDSDQNYLEPTPIGFKTGAKGDDDGAYFNQDGRTYVYMAIRRPNMVTITDATKVFDISAGADTNQTPFPVDMFIRGHTAGGGDNELLARLLGNNRLDTNKVSAKAAVGYDAFGSNTSAGGSGWGTAYVFWNWKRAKGYFDVVAYKPTQSGSGNEAITHGLGVVPEMIWVKVHDSGGSNDDWAVYHANMSGTPYNNALELNQSGGTATIGNQPYYWAQAHTNTAFYVYNGQGRTGDDGKNYIAFLFATLAGVSKCGGVTHSGSSTDVDCGFTSGARFVLLKRHDADGDWFVWDSARGIIAGNDPYLLLNDPATQVTNTDLIDPLASGFQISGDFTDGDYIFYAVA